MIEEMALAEVRQLDAGATFSQAYAGERVPTLPKVLDWARDPHIPLLIEIKGTPEPAPGIKEAVVSGVREAGLTDPGAGQIFFS